jgi:hypothetical protein
MSSCALHARSNTNRTRPTADRCGALLLRGSRPHSVVHGCACSSADGCDRVEVWPAYCRGLRPRMRYCLYQFLLAEAGDQRFCRSHDRRQHIAIRAGNRLAISPALRFDGSRRLCYIDCFTREPEWASCGLIFARSSYLLRSSIRGIRRCNTRCVTESGWNSGKRKAHSSLLIAVLCPNNSGLPRF